MTLYLLGVAVFLLLTAFLAVQFNILKPPVKGLPVLMYHKVLEGKNDGLTVSVAKFEDHLKYLQSKGYRTISFRSLKEMLRSGDPLPHRTVMLTFDDAYVNFSDHALPLLIKYGFTATVFVPVAYMGKTNIWDQGPDPIMNDADLRRLSNQHEIEIGLHSFLHRNYGQMTVSEVEDDLLRCRELLEHFSVPYVNVIAYPYGGYPKKDPVLRKALFAMFEKTGIDFALRIGNRINPWPVVHPYEMKRIDIRGTDSFFTFKTKLRKGHVRMFA